MQGRSGPKRLWIQRISAEAEAGRLVPGSAWYNHDRHESNVYKDQQQALKVFLAQARRINADYAQILSGLRKLKVEDVEPQKD